MSHVGSDGDLDFYDAKGALAAVLEAADYECQRCSGLYDLEAHHYLPKSRGGPDEPSNGICLCRKCHRGVHDHTLHDWFCWIDTRKGRAA